MVSGRMGRILVFCSYAREDEAVRAKLEESLAPLRDDMVIDDWYDNRIQPGSSWNAEIGSALETAKLVIFLVSPDLLASDYVREVELPKSLELERTGKCQIVPIVARKTDWGDSPLAQFQALPKEARPIASYEAVDGAYAEVVSGLADVCKRIVDWENPYKRAQVGDWTLSEQTTTLPDGRSVSVKVTVELTDKGQEEAVTLVQGAGGGEQLDQTVKIDLTRPLEDTFGESLRQLGEALPANAEMRIGPSRFDEETLMIGGRRYETVKATREIVFAQQGWEQSGTVATWRCIDVPLDGVVKGMSDLPGVARQNQVLLDYGHGDARSRKPELAYEAAPSGLVGPGHWRVEMAVLGVTSSFDLALRPDGGLEGSMGTMMGAAAQLQGRWAFDAGNNQLILQFAASVMGMPVGQETIQLQITGRDGVVLRGADAIGRQFALQRLG